jgi:hypothetical protein
VPDHRTVGRMLSVVVAEKSGCALLRAGTRWDQPSRDGGSVKRPDRRCYRGISGPKRGRRKRLLCVRLSGGATWILAGAVYCPSR